jgi:uncharacterized membrane protein YvlD (DUF360 family)
MSWLVMMLVRVVVFAIAIAFVTRRSSGVRVEPRKQLPLVALVFALLNVALYWLLSTAVTWGSLLTLSLVAPFVANAILIWVTSKLVKALRIDGLLELAYAALILTLVHFGLRLLPF